MRAKTIVTSVLLVFVVVSVVYLIFTETRKPSVTDELTGGRQESGEGLQAVKTADRQLIVYYFHGNKRCNTCRTIEAFTEEAITKGFADDLESGRVEWKTVNVDEPENGHFVGDFDLTTRSVVLVDVSEGAEERWTNLDLVWDLVENKDAFIDYITKNTNEYLVENDG